ncbi:hypothetical protein DEIPH_ctg066orf0014 [Deinococcus phoenicis]|uniref:Uncharacterized protein n=1 Tax=Deinococcus phoenicis TaxID=1476583 RepID=A0A016QLR2_9DEIO|nr:hypothetical protein DEIPH_ctg066orf0014 [Deinococcus phoenicis]
MVRALLDEGDEVFVLARRPMPFQHPRLHPLGADDTDANALQPGAFDRGVVWIHGTALEAPSQQVRGPCWHVLESAATNPARPGSQRRERFAALGNDDREVILGFVVEGNGSRWLTDEEISAGVLHALHHDLKRHVIGGVEPWSARP